MRTRLAGLFSAFTAARANGNLNVDGSAIVNSSDGSWLTFILRGVTALGVVGIGLFGLIVAHLVNNQENFIFHPKVPNREPQLNPSPFNHPSAWDIDSESVVVRTQDGENLHMWFMKQRQSAPTLVYFQGNAGNMGHRLNFFAIVYRALGFNILAVSYRGYGNSSGQPTEKGVFLDADAALAFLVRRAGVTLPDGVSDESSPANTPGSSNPVDLSRVFVFGRSLGGAVALHCGATHKELVAAVVVENTFLSIGDMALTLFPFLRPLRPVLDVLVRVPFNSGARVSKVDAPILFVSGLKDELVPPSHMQKLSESANHQMTDVFIVPNGTHNETWRQAGQQYPLRMQQFAAKVETWNREQRKFAAPSLKDLETFFARVGRGTGVYVEASFDLMGGSEDDSNGQCFNAETTGAEAMFQANRLGSKTAGM